LVHPGLEAFRNGSTEAFPSFLKGKTWVQLKEFSMNQQEQKPVVKAIRTYLDGIGHPISQVQGYEVLARALGHKSKHVLSTQAPGEAAPRKVSRPAVSVNKLEALSSRFGTELFVECFSLDEFGGESPIWAKVSLTQAFLEIVLQNASLCYERKLEHVSVDDCPDDWGPGEEDISWSLHVDLERFWFHGYPEYGQAVETRAVSIEGLLGLLQTGTGDTQHGDGAWVNEVLYWSPSGGEAFADEVGMPGNSDDRDNGDDGDPVVAAFAQEFAQFQIANERLIQALTDLAQPYADALSDLLNDVAADLKSQLGADAANAAGDDTAEQEEAIEEAESWVTDHVSNAGLAQHLAAVLLQDGVAAGARRIREALADLVTEEAKLRPATCVEAPEGFVRDAIAHVQARVPSVDRVTFDTDFQWTYTQPDGQWPSFDGLDVDVGLLEDACDAAQDVLHDQGLTLPVTFTLPHMELRADVVETLVDDVKDRSRKHGFRVTGRANALELASESAELYKLDATRAELEEAAKRLV
jgi:hypothetical protein